MLLGLSTTCGGGRALKQMMASGGPGMLGGGGDQPPGEEDALRPLMGDPRYWRDRDPKLVNHVEEGFRRLYGERSEEHTSELQSPMRNSYAVFCLKKKKIPHTI